MMIPVGSMRRERIAMVAGLLVLLRMHTVHAQEPIVGLHFGGPVRASLAVGVLWERNMGDRSAGPVLLAEPGIGGHRLSVGYVTMFGNLGSMMSVRASGLRLREGGGTNYAGLEAQWAPVFAIGGRFGAFMPLSSTQQKRLLWIGDVSFAI
jgi:hypothetical protein